MIEGLLQFIAPHLCINCQKIGSLLCDNCKYDIISESFDRCIACLQASATGICNHHKLPYAQAWCVGERRDSLQKLIGTYKFQNARAAHRILATLLDERLPQLPLDTVIVPVPTVSSHIRERGYDHIDLIAKRLSKLRQIPVERLINRVTQTTQRHTSRAERSRQATQAFALNKPTDRKKHYLIIDDVATTGSTIKQVATLLKQAGATNIWVAVIARQPLD